MADAAGLAHAARGDDDVEMVETVERLALVDRLGEADVPRLEPADQVVAVIEVGGMLGEDLRRLAGERRVDIDRDLGELALAHQLDEVADQLLRPLDREGRDEHRAPRIDRGADLVAEHDAAVLGGGVDAVAVAIGALAEDVVEAARPGRVRVEELVVGADVGGEEDADGALAVLRLDLDRGRAEEMAGVPEPRPDARQRLEPGRIADLAELLETARGIGHAVDRLDRRPVLPGVPLVELLDLHLLDVGRIGQHDAGEVDGGRGGVDRPGIAVAGELRQEAGMVDMGVAEDDGAEVARDEGEGAVVELLLGLRALEHAAIDEELAVVGLEPEARAGDAAGRRRGR